MLECLLDPAAARSGKTVSSPGIVSTASFHRICPLSEKELPVSEDHPLVEKKDLDLGLPLGIQSKK